MADNTTNYEFYLPEVDGSEDLWGDLLNQNWSNLDALLLDRDQDFAALVGRTLTAGDGLSGGGDLTQDRTLSVDGTVVRTSRSVSAGDGLTGGGDLSTDLTITMGDPGTLDGGTPNNVTGDSHTHAITSTASRTDSSTTTLLQAAGMNGHRTSGDHDARYAQLAGGAAANFAVMPQVGGVPIVESGSNSDGRWTRYADGTQICTHLIDLGDVTAAGSGTISSPYRTNGNPWSFPVPFAERPSIAGTAECVTSAIAVRRAAAFTFGTSGEASETVALNFAAVRISSSDTSDNFLANLTATGRH